MSDLIQAHVRKTSHRPKLVHKLPFRSLLSVYRRHIVNAMHSKLDDACSRLACTCSRTAPITVDDASAALIVGRLGSQCGESLV